MKNFLSLAGLALAVQLSAVGATIVPGAGCGNCAAAPFPFDFNGNSDVTIGIPFWNNPSRDSNPLGPKNGHATIGNFLTGTGGFSGGPNYLNYDPANTIAANGPYYLSGDGTNGNTYQPLNFTLSNGPSLALQITLLSLNGDLTAYDTTKFGIYDTTNNSKTLLWSIGSTPVNTVVNIHPSASFGFYLEECAPKAGGGCTTQTFYTNSGLNTTDGNQHFAVFAKSLTDFNTGNFFIGMEDSSVLNDPIEHVGDFNDIIIKVSTIHNPEPATFVLIGIGLVGLGAAKRFRKS